MASRKKRTEYLKQSLERFVSSFTNGKLFLGVLLYDLIFVFFVVALVKGVSSLLFSIASGLQNFGSLTATEATLNTLQVFLAQSASIFVLFLLVLLFAYTLSRSFIWLALVSKRYTWRFFWKFLGLNAFWLALWLVVWGFLMIGLQPSYAAIATVILPILFVYTTTILHYVFTNAKKPLIGDALAQMPGIALGKAHKFILPYILSIIVFLLWSQVWRFIPKTPDLVFQGFIVVAIIFVPFFAWFRGYMVRVLKAL